MKIITGSSGQINELLKGIPDKDVSDPSSFGDGKIMIGIRGNFIPSIPGEVVEKIVEVEVDNPENLAKITAFEIAVDNYSEKILDLDGQVQTLQDALADALNAEEKAKKEAEDLKKQIPKLKASVAKLKKALSED